MPVIRFSTFSEPVIYSFLQKNLFALFDWLAVVLGGFASAQHLRLDAIRRVQVSVVKKGEEIISSIDLFKVCAAVICIFCSGSCSFVEKVTLLQNKKAN